MQSKTNFTRKSKSPKTIKIYRPVSERTEINRLSTQVRLIEKQLIETKYLDELNNFTPSSSGQSFCLVNFAQGDTVSTRNGNKVFIENIELRYYVETNSALQGPVNLRVIVVYDTAPSGQTVNLGIGGVATMLGPTGVLDNTVITGSPQIMPHAFEMKYRYKILHDRVHTLNPIGQFTQSITNNTSATATVTGGAILNMEQFAEHNIQVQKETVYQDASANLVSLLKGSIVAVCYSDQTSNLPFVVMGTRVFFKDA